MVFEFMLSAKASTKQLEVFAEMLDSKNWMVIILRGIPVMCFMVKNAAFPVFLRIVFYILRS
jgi:hypothetical protein